MHTKFFQTKPNAESMMEMEEHDPVASVEEHQIHLKSLPKIFTRTRVTLSGMSLEPAREAKEAKTSPKQSSSALRKQLWVEKLV